MATFDVLPHYPLTDHRSPFAILRHSIPVMESDDEQQQTSSFFEDIYYTYKSDIIQAVVEFNRVCNRPSCVVSCDKGSYKAVRIQPGCFILVHFAFSQNFSPPTSLLCSPVIYPDRQRHLEDMLRRNRLLQTLHSEIWS